MSTHVKYAVSTLIALAGSAVSLYLLDRTWKLTEQKQIEGFDLCSAVFGAGCDDTLLSATSWWLGVPVAGWGLMYFASAAVLLASAWLLRKYVEVEAFIGLLVLVAGGLGVSAFLSYQLVTGRSPFCPMCVVTHAINIVMAGMVVSTSPVSVGDAVRRIRGGIGKLLSDRTPTQQSFDWRIAVFLPPVIVSAVAYYWIDVRSTEASAFRIDPAVVDEMVSDFIRQRPSGVRTRPDDPRMGPRDADAIVVVFTSFQCPGCKAFASMEHELVERFGGDAAVVFKHFPLSTKCNASMMGNDMHEMACDIAWAAEAARLQGKFWEYHDAIFAPDDLHLGEERLVEIAEEIGLDVERFNEDRASAAVKQRVQEDIQHAIALGVTGTPAIFVNGRRAPHATQEVYERFLEETLGRERRSD